MSKSPRSLLVAKYITPLIAFGIASAAIPGTATTYVPKTNNGYGNGYRVFLSPASHSPDRPSCLTADPLATENEMAWMNSATATNGYDPNSLDLTERGWTVQIGSGTNQEKVIQANTWGTHIFVSVHSNGILGGCTTTQAKAGTWGMYRTSDTNSKNLADWFHYWVSPASPGTNDKSCLISTCSNSTTLLEMETSKAPTRAYLEQEFHDYQAGATWMINNITWQWRIAASIDGHYGNPR